ncbi:MAG: FHA domain-containing protein [bacterium]|nr:FHA domain-containing protein [bacterium]
MKCSVCGSDNLEGSAYCEDCGSRLAMTPAAPVMAAPAPPAPEPAAPAAVPVPVSVDEAPAAPSVPVEAAPISAPVSAEMPAPAGSGSVLCPSCGAMNSQGGSFCEDCGASLAAASARKAPAPLPISSPAAAPAPALSIAPASGVVPVAVARPRLVVSGTSVEFPLDREVILLGRNSPADGIFPEVDLTEIDTGSYISRRHGRITRQATAFLYEDMGSSNGSFINGNKLTAKTQIELHDGDTLRLGRTEMCFRI